MVCTTVQAQLVVTTLLVHNTLGSRPACSQYTPFPFSQYNVVGSIQALHWQRLFLYSCHYCCMAAVFENLQEGLNSRISELSQTS